MNTNGQRVSFGVDESLHELDSGNGCLTFEYTKRHRIIHFKC